MLFFYDVPSDAPKGIGSNAFSSEDACAEIQAEWKNYFSKCKLAKPHGKALITIETLGNALSRLNVDGMPLDRCHQYVQLYLESSSLPFPKTINARSWMGGLSTDHRRCADELLACTLSLDASRVNGYKFIGHRDYVNEELSVFGTDAWTYIWKYKGPDYLLAGNRHFAFLESKGQANTVRRTPVDFAEYKTQSLNAELCLRHGAGSISISARHILSYVYLPAEGLNSSPVPAFVQWFNNAFTHQYDERSDFQPGSGVLTAAVALAELSLHCRNQGVDHLDVLYNAWQNSNIDRSGILAISNSQMSFIIFLNSKSNRTLAIANRCVKILRQLHKLLNNLAFMIRRVDNFMDNILVADKVAFRLLEMLEKSSILSDADKNALKQNALNIRFDITQQIFSTGLFTVFLSQRSQLFNTGK